MIYETNYYFTFYDYDYSIRRIILTPIGLNTLIAILNVPQECEEILP